MRLPRSRNHDHLGLFGVGAAAPPKDGNEFEIMWMLPRQHWGKSANAAPVEPLELDAELAQWSGVPTAGRITVSNSDEDNQ